MLGFSMTPRRLIGTKAKGGDASCGGKESLGLIKLAHCVAQLSACHERLSEQEATPSISRVRLNVSFELAFGVFKAMGLEQCASNVQTKPRLRRIHVRGLA